MQPCLACTAKAYIFMYCYVWMHANQVENQIIYVRVSIMVWILPAVLWRNRVNTIEYILAFLCIHPHQVAVHVYCGWHLQFPHTQHSQSSDKLEGSVLLWTSRPPPLSPFLNNENKQNQGCTFHISVKCFNYKCLLRNFRFLRLLMKKGGNLPPC